VDQESTALYTWGREKERTLWT